jgi:hypothetical protein
MSNISGYHIRVMVQAIRSMIFPFSLVSSHSYFIGYLALNNYLIRSSIQIRRERKFGWTLS